MQHCCPFDTRRSKQHVNSDSSHGRAVWLGKGDCSIRSCILQTVVGSFFLQAVLVSAVSVVDILFHGKHCSRINYCFSACTCTETFKFLLLFGHPSQAFQGIVLSSFFTGYALTQVRNSTAEELYLHSFAAVVPKIAAF